VHSIPPLLLYIDLCGPDSYLCSHAKHVAFKVADRNYNPAVDGVSRRGRNTLLPWRNLRRRQFRLTTWGG
jgi:hypothetical protein